MIMGIILALLFIVTAGRFITKRYLKCVNRFAGKFHMITGSMIMGLLIIHIVVTWPLRKQRPIEIYISGIIMLLCCIAAIMSWTYRKKLGALWIRIHRTAALLMLVCLVFHVYMGISSLGDYKKSVADITVQNIDITGIRDGVYIGECNVGYIYAKVEVHVEDGKITEVELLEHRTERGHAAESIVDDIVEEQKIDVDTVSGATNSSKVIMKAVENALRD